MMKFIAGLFLGLLCLFAGAAERLTMGDAVRKAEQFVAENGYTNLPDSRMKKELNAESIEWTADRQKQIAQRAGTLSPVAIGAKSGRKHAGVGWSVAFDYAANEGERVTCRVVTMALDGADMRVEHVDGIRKYFLGFENK